MMGSRRTNDRLEERAGCEATPYVHYLATPAPSGGDCGVFPRRPFDQHLEPTTHHHLVPGEGYLVLEVGESEETLRGDLGGDEVAAARASDHDAGSRCESPLAAGLLAACGQR